MKITSIRHFITKNIHSLAGDSKTITTIIIFHILCRRKQEEVILLEEKIRQRSEQQKKAGVELDATCHICLKTKFADGVGHLCNYCGIRCCARCGGKVTLRSSKVSISLVTIHNMNK